MKQTALNDQNTEIQSPILNTLLSPSFCHSSEDFPESCNFLKYKNPFKKIFCLLGWTKNNPECNYYPLTSSFGSPSYATSGKWPVATSIVICITAASLNPCQE